MKPSEGERLFLGAVLCVLLVACAAALVWLCNLDDTYPVHQTPAVHSDGQPINMSAEDCAPLSVRC